jgi:hypothetical protein
MLAETAQHRGISRSGLQFLEMRDWLYNTIVGNVKDDKGLKMYDNFLKTI